MVSIKGIRSMNIKLFKDLIVVPKNETNKCELI
jgi:hypothetical protein